MRYCAIRWLNIMMALSVFSLLSWADNNNNDSCNGELISELHAISATTSRTETGNVSLFDTNDYYYFKPGVAGTLTYSYSSTASTDFYLSKNGCGQDRKVNNGTSLGSTNLTVAALDTIYIRVTRRSGSPSYSVPMTFTVQEQPPIMGNIPDQTAYVGVAFTMSPAISTYVTATNNDPITGYTLTGSVPGLTFNTATGALSGTLTTAGTYNLSVTATDNDGVSNATSFSITVLSESLGGRDFILRKNENLFGDVKVIGNTVLCVKNSSGQCVESPNLVSNDDLNLQKVDASNATLDIPTGSIVKYARLYWQGRQNTNSNTEWSSDQKTSAKEIWLKKDSGGEYQQITADIADFDFTSSSGNIRIYSASAEITNLISGNGVYYIDPARFYTFAGDSSDGLGAYGAWTLVIIYEDPSSSAKLRNISIFDGYKKVTSGTNVDIAVSGFITPTSGLVDSRVQVFAGEGDKYLAKTGDVIRMAGLTYNTAYQTLGTFDSRIDVPTTRYPNLINNNGIDIHEYNTGTSAGGKNIITNNEVGARFRFTSDQDLYFPSLIVFSTQLYVPDVCYLEDVTYNGLPITSSNLPQTDDNVEYEVTITNKNDESAKGVFVEKVFNKPNQMQYVPNSMKIQPISGAYVAKTDTIGDDTAEYSVPTQTAKFLLGTGAQYYEGGAITKDAITKFKYQAKIGDTNASENTYLVSYRNDILGITFSGIPIRKCQDFNNSFGIYIPEIGNFNTVRPNAVNRVSGPDPLDPLAIENALYTQIVNAPFSVDVLAFNSDNITPRAWSGDLNLSIVELPPSGECSEANSTLGISTVSTLTFNNETFKTITVTPLKATSKAVFKMVTPNASLCSRDQFAIRPAGYSMDANETRLIGNRIYRFDFKAHTYGSPTVESYNYNQIVHNEGDKNATTQLYLPVGSICALARPVEYTNVPLSFSEGVVSGLITYPNVGDVNITIADKKWSEVDYLMGKEDCIANSFSNIPDGSGKIGCLTQTSKIFSFVPKDFNATMTISNGSGNNRFTYVSDEQNMSSALIMTTTARLNDNTAAINYTANCFARDINTTLSLINNQALRWSNTQNRILYFDDNNVSSMLINQNNFNGIYLTREGNFTNGVATVRFRFNFDRNEIISDNPFNIARNDFNITQIIDQNQTEGNDFNRLNDANATFVYGRVIPRDVRVFGAVPFSVNAWYEVFNTPAIEGIALPVSHNDTLWNTNILHNDSTDGDANVTRLISAGAAASVNYGGNDVMGVETFAFPAIAPIYNGKAHVDTAPWLWHAPNASAYSDPSTTNPANAGGNEAACLTHPCFNVTVMPAIGATGSAKSTNEANKGSKNSTQGTGWRSTSDYAPAIR